MDVHLYPDTSSALYIHAKVIVVDAGTATEKAFVGSENFSTASMGYNRELGIIVNNPAIVRELARVLGQDYDGAAPDGRSPTATSKPTGGALPLMWNAFAHASARRGPLEATGLCKAAHARLLTTVATITDEQVSAPSRLPGWTIGHVLTHLARNADGHTRRLEGAMRGEDVPRYPGGSAQREADISDGAKRLPAGLLEDTASPS